MKHVFFTVLILLLAVYVAALDFPETGFSIPALDASPNLEEGTSQTRLFMFMQADNNFAANVHVMIQKYSESIQAYKSLSESQFKSMGWTVVSSTIEDGAYYVEYSGMQNGQLYHFYSKALSTGEYVYLATATTLESAWTRDRDRLIPVVNGLELN